MKRERITIIRSKLIVDQISNYDQQIFLPEREKIFEHTAAKCYERKKMARLYNKHEKALVYRYTVMFSSIKQYPTPTDQT
jgi:catabolite regulation protein CreA